MKKKLSFLLAFLLFFQLIDNTSYANSTDLNLSITENSLIIEAKEKIIIKEIELNNEIKDLTKEKYYSDKDKSLSLEKNQKLFFKNTYPSHLEYKISYLKDEEIKLLKDTVYFNKNIIVENLNQKNTELIKPGETGSISFEIKNNQNSEIKDLEVQYIGIDSLQLLGTNKIEKITSLSSMDKKVINYDIIVSSLVKQDILEVPIGLKYKLKQNLVEEQVIIKLPINVSDTPLNKSLLENVKNSGNVQSDIYLPKLNTTKDSSSDYNIRNYGEDLSSSPEEVFQISGSEDIKNKPKLIVDNYAFNPRPLKAGEDFDLTISFFNTNNEKRINNIRIVLNSSGSSSTLVEEDFKTSAPSYPASVFTPVNSSNTFYIDYIEPKSRMEKKLH